MNPSIFRRLSLLVAVLFSASVLGAAQSSTLTGKVIAVPDGDTVVVADKKRRQHTVELAGIDAPEGGQAFSQKAQAFLFDQVMERTVVVEGRRYDRNGRILGKVLVSGRDINLEMLISGLAWHFKEYAGEQTDRDRQLYESAEFYARKSKFNLWSDANAVAPWLFDKTKTQATAAADANPPSLTEAPAMVPLVDITKKDKSAVEPPSATLTPDGEILGNKKSKIYHWEGCPGFTRVDEKNRVYFKTRSEAEVAGYRAAKNCK